MGADVDPAPLARRMTLGIRGAMAVEPHIVRATVAAVLAEGHVLVEGPPGVGKTTLARALAATIAGSYQRIQATADLLPGDLLGTNVFQRATETFVFHPGPVFANVVLIDEFNRAPPRTQSGLLECMQEGHVSIGGETRPLPRPFVVVATQNPLDPTGTYPLSEAQLDRFSVRVRLGPPEADVEVAMLETHTAADPVAELEAVAALADIVEAQRHTADVRTAEPLRRYVVSLLRHVRDDPRVLSGPSPRAGIMLLRAAQAVAGMDGRDHALPDDVKAMAQTVLAHRVVPARGTDTAIGGQVVLDALRRVPAA